MKCITEGIPKFNLNSFLDFDLEEIYMFCAVNCIENPYIANYLKTRKQIEYEESTNERENISQYPPSVYYDESGNEEELPIQSISSTKSLKELIKPTHDVVKKKKRKKNKGKKVPLPNDVAPTIVPHESESNMLMEDDNIEHDFLLPTTLCNDYDWEDNNINYDLENILALAWKNKIIMFAILLVPFMPLIRMMVMICKITSLGKLCLMSMKYLRIYLLN